MRWQVLGFNQGAFVPRYRVTAPLVCAKGHDGRLRHCYKGDLLDYLDDDQRDHFLRKGLVERVTENDLRQSDSSASRQPQAAIGTPAAVDLNPDIVNECVADLDRLEVAPDAGAPTARTALRESGARYSNDVIAAAVRSRKQRVAVAVPDSADSG